MAGDVGSYRVDRRRGGSQCSCLTEYSGWDARNAALRAYAISWRGWRRLRGRREPRLIRDPYTGEIRHNLRLAEGAQPAGATMTVRRRRQAPADPVDGLVVFRWSLGEIPGLESLLDVPVYPSRPRRGAAGRLGGAKCGPSRIVSIFPILRPCSTG